MEHILTNPPEDISDLLAIVDTTHYKRYESLSAQEQLLVRVIHQTFDRHELIQLNFEMRFPHTLNPANQMHVENTIDTVMYASKHAWCAQLPYSLLDCKKTTQV